MKLFEPSRSSAAFRAGVGVSIALHVALGLGLILMNSNHSKNNQDNLIRMAILDKPQAQPKAPPAKPQATEPKSKPKKPLKIRKIVEAPPPPPNSKPAPQPEHKPTRPVFGLSMNSVVQSGGNGHGMTVQVGNTLATEPKREPIEPDQVRPYIASPVIRKNHSMKIIPSYKLTQMPAPKRLIKARYPEKARIEGIQGDILMRLTIDEQGKVRRVNILKGLGHGLDKLARQAAKDFLFEPARIEDTPVACVIPFTYRWEIVD